MNLGVLHCIVLYGLLENSCLVSEWAQPVCDPVRDSQAVPGSVKGFELLAQTSSLHGAAVFDLGESVCVWLVCKIRFSSTVKIKSRCVIWGRDRTPVGK